MKKTGFVIFLVVLLQASIALAAPIISMDDMIIAPGQTAVDVGLTIITDATSPVDSATFTVIDIPGLTLTNVNVVSPAGWMPTVALPKFGATDFGWPANPIVADTLFATLSYSFADDFFQGGARVKVEFSFLELADDWGMPHDPAEIQVQGGNVSAIPLPGAVLLLGSGLFGLIGIRRRMS